MVPFLKKANERFDKPTSRNLAQAQREKKQKEQEKQKQKAEEQKVRDTATKAGKDPDQAVKEWKQKQKDDAAKKKQTRPSVSMPSKKKWCSGPTPPSS